MKPRLGEASGRADTTPFVAVSRSTPLIMAYAMPTVGVRDWAATQWMSTQRPSARREAIVRAGR